MHSGNWHTLRTNRKYNIKSQRQASWMESVLCISSYIALYHVKSNAQYKGLGMQFGRVILSTTSPDLWISETPSSFNIISEKKKNNKNYLSERKIKKFHMATVEDEIRFPEIHLPLPEPRISHVTYITNGKTTIIESIKEQIKWKSCGLTLLFAPTQRLPSWCSQRKYLRQTFHSFAVYVLQANFFLRKIMSWMVFQTKSWNHFGFTPNKTFCNTFLIWVSSRYIPIIFCVKKRRYYYSYADSEGIFPNNDDH